MAKPNHVCIVDDDASVRRALSRLTAAMGYAVETFSTGEELLRYLGRSSTGCLVLDIELPGLDGYEIQQRLVETGTGIPVIVITGKDEPELRRWIRGHEVVACLIKPFDDEDLLQAIRAALGEKPARDTSPEPA